MQVKERIAKLREAMSKSGLDGYLVPTADFHESEYVGAHFKARAWLSGFQGSAGTLLVEKESARLWTDGRYFIAAAQQLEGSGIELMRMGEEGVPTLEEYLEKSLPQGGALGFDGRVVNANLGERLMRILRKKEGRLETQGDLVDEVWKDRPPLSARAAYFLEEKYAGESRVSKLARLREQMAAKGATAHVLTSLDDIAWLMNLRGDDVEYNPVVLSYALITPASAILYANRVVFSEYMVRDLERDGVTLRPYDRIYQDDLCGWLGQLGYEDETAWFSAVYEAGGEEQVAAVGFYATGPDTEYEIYQTEITEDGPVTGARLAQGSVLQAGFYTLRLENGQKLSAGERFSVAIKIRTPEAKHPVAVEYGGSQTERAAVVDLSDGEGYISADGRLWSRTEPQQSNVCLKIYTNRR